MNNAISMNLVGESNHTVGDTKVAVRVCDKYFMKNGNRASLTLTVVGCGNDVFVSAIGAGGGQGIFLNTSFGAEEEMVEIVQDSIEQMK